MKQKGLFICLFAVMVTVMSAGSASAQVNLLCDPAGCQVDYSTVAQTAWGLQCTGCVSRAELDFTPGTVTSVGTGTGLEGGPITGTGTISLMNTTVTPGTYTRGNFTVDAQGRLTAASSGASVNLEGEVTGVLPTGHGGTGTTSGPTAAQQYLRSTGAGIWGISTIQLSDLPSLSGNYVDLSTAQTVGGSKTFTGRIGASAGLTFGDGTIQTTAAVPPLPAATVPGKTGLTTLDNMATVGLFTSITIGTDGLPVISHQDVGASRILKVAKCGNASCSTACGSGGTVCTTLDGTGDVGQYTSITIGTDGLPVISYYDIANSSLKVAKCGNASCSTACNSGGTVCRTLDNTASVGQFTSITIGTDGLPVISYYDADNTSLKVAKCGNVDCSTACGSGGTVCRTLDNTASVGQYTSITIGTDWLPVISYYDADSTSLKVAKCGNVDCSTACGMEGTVCTTLDNTASVGQYTSITIGTDGLPVIAYYDADSTSLKVAKCGNASCSTACGSGGTVCTTLDGTGDVGQFTSITIGTDGFPVISYYDIANSSLKVAKCGNASCSTACGAGGTVCRTLDNTASVGQFTSVTIGTDGFPVISYWDSNNTSLKVAKCNNIYCQSNWSRR